VAAANLKLFVDEDLPAMARHAADILADALHAFDGLTHVGDVRRRGIMCGVELVADRDTKEPFPADLQVGKQVCDALVDDGVILRPLGDTLVIMPAPAMAEQDLRFLVEAAARATDRVTTAVAAGAAT
jgi:adenosylmethionine-8-amino-7-oxononanoate aminotransferase